MDVRAAQARVIAAATLAFSLAVGCAPRPRLCVASSECPNESACVAGRCQLDKASMKPAVDNARRLVVRPVDVAYVRAGDGPSRGALPAVFALGRDGGKLFLRFAVTLPPSANVVEAYVVLRRAVVVDDDPAPIFLHSTRIIEPWSGGAVRWAIQPRTAEVRSPSTIVEPGGPSLVRVDVRDMVRCWTRRDPMDQGIAIVADSASHTGATFAFSAVGAERAMVGALLAEHGEAGPLPGPDVGPYLEIYVR